MTDQLPAVPAPTGNPYADSVARTQHFEALTGYFAKNPPAATVSRLTVAPSAPQPPAKTPAVPAAPQPAARTVAPAAPSTAAPQLPAGDVDQRALGYLTDLRRTTPAARQTSQWRAAWERDYAEVLSGRKMYESSDAFTARTAAAAKVSAVPATPAETADAGDVVGVTSDAFSAEQLHGYTLPSGVEFDRDMTVALLKIARTAGVPQRFVDAYIRNN